MSTLVSRHKTQYEEEGYLVVEDLLTQQELQRLHQRTIDIAEGRVDFPPELIELEPGATQMNVETVRKINGCAESDPVFLAHAGNERILDLVASLIGPDIKLFGSQIFMKPPGGVEKPYHQDSAYFFIEPMALVTCWAALDDVTLENGCMWVVPGSQRLGVLDHSQSWQIGDRVDKRVPESAFDQQKEVPITMKAGSCSFHHSLMLHKSNSNQTQNPRRGAAVHYMSATSRWTHPSLPKPDYKLLRGQEYPGCV